MEIDGRPLIQCNVRDTTERKRTLEELFRYRNHLEELVQQRTRELAEAFGRRQKVPTVRRAPSSPT